MKSALLIVLAALSPFSAIAAPTGYFDLGPQITLESGDTWRDDKGRYRLYGVQSCLRGTTYTDTQGRERDCGEASMAMFAAFIEDTSPVCAPVMRTPDLTYVMCYATVGRQRSDLGLLLINSGYAFAALDAEGMPYQMAYALAEQTARKKKEGLWQFSDVVHPAVLMSTNARHGADGTAK